MGWQLKDDYKNDSVWSVFEPAVENELSNVSKIQCVHKIGGLQEDGKGDKKSYPKLPLNRLKTFAGNLHNGTHTHTFGDKEKILSARHI